jgi:hypothetical protein
MITDARASGRRARPAEEHASGDQRGVVSFGQDRAAALAPAVDVHAVESRRRWPVRHTVVEGLYEVLALVPAGAIAAPVDKHADYPPA